MLLSGRRRAMTAADGSSQLRRIGQAIVILPGGAGYRGLRGRKTPTGRVATEAAQTPYHFRYGSSSQIRRLVCRNRI
jgi:hypothetical protein